MDRKNELLLISKIEKCIGYKELIEILKMEEQTPEICLAAVKKNGLALEFVKEQMKNLTKKELNKLNT